MEYTLEDKLRVILENNNNVKIVKSKKTKDGEIFYRYSWEVDDVHDLGWWGFDNIDECVDDCIGYLALRDYEPTTK